MTDSPTPVAIVTGAGSGVGRDAAVLLAEAGYRVVLVARTPEKLEETASLIRGERDGAPEPITHPADVTDPGAVAGVVERAASELGRLDAVVNVAGTAPLLPIEKIDAETWRSCVDTNLSAVVLMTAAAWPVFRKQKRGFVANVSSMASIDPFPGFSIYAAAKVGVNMFTRCTASEGKKIGVRAVCVAPGAIETPMLRANFSEKMIPADKSLDPVVVAGVLRDCITGARNFEPGETIVLESP